MKHSEIKEILDLGGKVTFKITAADLQAVIREIVLQTKRELEAEIAKNNSDILLTSEDVLQRLSISRRTLYNWEQKNYLVSIEIGGKRRYRLSDINEILKK